MVQELLDTPGVTTRSLAAATYDESLGREVLNKDFWSRMGRGLVPRAPLASELELMAHAMRERISIVKAAAAAQYLNYMPVHLSGYGDDMRRIIIETGAMDPDEQRRVRIWLETLRQDK
jgi:hypothetical protein